MRHGIVVCPEPLAAEVGAAVLRSGGNAADAATATALAQGVVDPMMTGIGGTAGFVHVSGATGEATYVAAGGCAPELATESMWADRYVGRDGTTWRVQGDANLIGYQASLVPGNLRGLEALHTRFGSGRKPWRDLVAPSIELAEAGYEIPEWQWNQWRPREPIGVGSGQPDPLAFLTHSAAAAAIYAPEGRALRVGERLVQRDYGRTLRLIADQGVDAFYEGEIAEAMIADFTAHGGLITARDLRDYRAIVEPASSGTFHEFGVHGSHSPSLGPITQLMLNVLEGYDLTAFARDGVAFADLLTRVMHVAYVERRRQLADPKEFELPMAEFLSKGYAAELRAALDGGIAAGHPGSLRGRDISHTTALVVMDRAGNTVALSQSINSGSGVVTPGLGFLHNNHMWMFDPRPGRRNSIRPGRVPIGGLATTVVTLDRTPVAAFASPNGSLGSSACLQVMLDVLLFGASAQDAVDAPRVHSEDRPNEVAIEERRPDPRAAGLEALGRRVVRRSHIGVVSAIHRSGSSVQGGSDPRMGAGMVLV